MPRPPAPSDPLGSHQVSIRSTNLVWLARLVLSPQLDDGIDRLKSDQIRILHAESIIAACSAGL